MEDSNNEIAPFWDFKRRRCSWYLMTKSRNNLKLEISPTIATTFTILQNYFRVNQKPNHSLFILIATSLYSSCKFNHEYRPLEQIKNALELIFYRLPPKIKNIIAENEIKRSNNDIEFFSNTAAAAEIDILSAIDYRISFDLPFNHIDDSIASLKLNTEMRETVVSNIRLCLCSIMCHEKYLDFPVDACAASGIIMGLKMSCIYFTSNFVQRCIEAYGMETINKIANCIQQILSSTVLTKDITIPNTSNE